MKANRAVHLIPGWAKLAAVLILLVSLLLGGILGTPSPGAVLALNTPLQVTAPRALSSSIGVNGTLASFTALISPYYLSFFPHLSK